MKLQTALFSLFLVAQACIVYALFFPLHDTLYYFQVFHVAYSNYYYHHEVTQWLPFSAYGLSADWYFYNCMTVFKYLFILLGDLFAVKASFVLFTTAMLFEQGVFLLGVYLLARSLFKSVTTVLFVCICTLGSCVVNVQAGLNFYAYYLLPLIFFCIRLFFLRQKYSYLAFACLLLLLSVPGQAVYFLLIMALECLVVFAMLGLHHRQEWRKFLAPSRRDLLMTAVCAGAVLLFLGLLLHSTFAEFSDYKTLSVGRDPISKQTPLDVFLVHGGQLGLDKFLDLIVPQALGTPHPLDLTLFIGLIAWPFIIYALVTVRDPFLRALSFTVVILGLFSLGGYFCTATYYCFPGMKYYRHIGLSIASFKLFLPLMAGFGLDRLLGERALLEKRAGLFKVLLACLLLAGAVIYYVATGHFPKSHLTAGEYVFVATAVALAVVATRRPFAVAVLAALCVELLGYQLLTHVKCREWLASEPPPSLGQIVPAVFPETRTLAPWSGRASELMPFFGELTTQTVSYAFYYNFVQWDPAYNNLRTDIVNSKVAALIEARGGMVTNLNMLLRTDDAYLMSVLGSTRPKLRLLTNVAFSESESESVERIRSFRDADSPLVLNGVPKPIQDAWRNYGGSNRSVTVLVSNGVPPNIQDTLVNAGDSDRRITVRDFSLNRLALNADVSDALGAWLYYADAYDPAWKAYNNGQPTTIYQANVAFKAIKLPSGTNRVEFVFAPGGAVKFSTYAFIIYGLILSLACVCGFVMVLWPGARRPLPITGEGSHTARLLDDGGGPAQV